MSQHASILSFPSNDVGEQDWVSLFLEEGLEGRAASTITTYRTSLRKFIRWVNEHRSTYTHHSHTEWMNINQLSHSLVKDYIAHLKSIGQSVSTQQKDVAALQSFCEFLIERQVMQRANPARHIPLPMKTFRPARELSPEQRTILCDLFLDERWDDTRGAAMFALGYYAGCRVSDVSHLLVKDILTLTRKQGIIRVGFKGGKYRDIELHNDARKYLALWMEERDFPIEDGRHAPSPYAFYSQRGEQLSTQGIHEWLRYRKEKATIHQYPLIQKITFHDLRHDFAHRCIKAGWTLSMVAEYLGHMDSKGVPNPRVTERYAQATKNDFHDALQKL